MRGGWFEAVQDLEKAAELYRDGPRPLAYASALEDLGRVRVASGGDTALAIGSFDEALSITTRTGAEWDSARLRGRLRRLGVRRRLGNERPKTGWVSLTEPEINVATLAAEGRTNRQIAESLFISPHTVNTHLGHVFEKLGINSRVQLSRFVRERTS
jgi:DNA-binding CsgD family transcriptional regulator